MILYLKFMVEIKNCYKPILIFFFNSLLYVDGLYVSIIIFLCVQYINKNRLNETGLPYYSFFSIYKLQFSKFFLKFSNCFKGYYQIPAPEWKVVQDRKVLRT